MAIFSNSWTGRSDPEVMEAPAPIVERLESAPKLKPRKEARAVSGAAIAEYREVATSIGVSAQDILVEEFRAFLAEKDIPTFNYQEVVKYMDEIAAKDNPTGLGWHWCPVREKDAEVAMTFGKPSVQQWDNRGQQRENGPSSDFYESHRFTDWHRNGGGGWIPSGAGWVHMNGGVVMGSSNSRNSVHVESNARVIQAAHDAAFHEATAPAPRRRDWRDEKSPVYTRTLPLHALKKIALVEREFKSGQVVFLVTDYTIAPHVVINPDPFLMAIIPNSAIAHGKGRFIIDVWDEPGFGLSRMLK